MVCTCGTKSSNSNSRVLLIFLSFGSRLTFLQKTYYFKRYDKENGLSPQTVFYCSLGSWSSCGFSTKVGLNRFNGTKFKNYVANPEQPKIVFRDDTVLALTGIVIFISTSRWFILLDPEKDVLLHCQC